MRNHKGHTLLGNYCWNCQRPTKAGVPGWPKHSKNDGPKDINLVPTSVVWADGTEDISRNCEICKSPVCKYPVHKDEYSEI